MEVPYVLTYGIKPTYYGIVASTQDARILIEACLRGDISHASRRPHDEERRNMIQSGNVFVYVERASGIKRWTDGVPWSPSRAVNGFLIYREINKSASPVRKDRLKEQTALIKSNPTAKDYIKAAIRAKGKDMLFPEEPEWVKLKKVERLETDLEKSIVGTLEDPDFVEDGLVKKTISVTVRSVTHHVVSYYNVSDVLQSGKLQMPSTDPKFMGLEIRWELMDPSSGLSADDPDVEDHSLSVFYGDFDRTDGSFGHMKRNRSHAMKGFGRQRIVMPFWQGPSPRISPEEAYFKQLLHQSSERLQAPFPQQKKSMQKFFWPNNPRSQNRLQSNEHNLRQQQHSQKQSSQRQYQLDNSQGQQSQEQFKVEQYEMDVLQLPYYQNDQFQHNRYQYNQHQDKHPLQDINQNGFMQRYTGSQWQYSNDQLQSTSIYPVQPLNDSLPTLDMSNRQVANYPAIGPGGNQTIPPVLMDGLVSTTGMDSMFDSNLTVFSDISMIEGSMFDADSALNRVDGLISPAPNFLGMPVDGFQGADRTINSSDQRIGHGHH